MNDRDAAAAVVLLLILAGARRSTKARAPYTESDKRWLESLPPGELPVQRPVPPRAPPR